MAFDPGHLTFTYQGHSMLTLFHPGETIEVSSNFNLIEGGVYVFNYQGELTIHRLIKINGTELVFKGDCSLLSEVISQEMIFGRVHTPLEPIFLNLSQFYSKDKARPIRFMAKSLMLTLSKFIF